MQSSNAGGERPAHEHTDDVQDVVRPRPPHRVSPIEQYPAGREAPQRATPQPATPQSWRARAGFAAAAAVFGLGAIGLAGVATYSATQTTATGESHSAPLRQMIGLEEGLNALHIIGPQEGLTIHAGPSLGSVEVPCVDVDSEVTSGVQTLRLTCSDSAFDEDFQDGPLDIVVPLDLPVKIIGGGPVHAEGELAYLTVESDNDVTLTDFRGDLNLQTRGEVSGNITRGGFLRIDSGSAITLGLHQAIPTIAITSSGGDVTLTIPPPEPPGRTYDLTLSATNGRVLNSVPDTEGSTNKVQITTSQGDIQIRTAHLG